MKKITFLSLASILFCCFACNKEDKDGNANIKSVILNLSTADWARNLNDLYSYKDFNSLDIVTQKVVDEGALLVYYKPGVGNPANESWRLMPLAFIGNGDAGYTEWSVAFNYRLNTLQIRAFADSDQWFEPDLTLKVVTISAEGMMAPVRWEEYEEVQAYFELEE